MAVKKVDSSSRAELVVVHTLGSVASKGAYFYTEKEVELKIEM